MPASCQLDQRKMPTGRQNLLRPAAITPMPRAAVTGRAGLVVHRLDIPAELAETLAQEAEANERTVPAQIRFALKQWATRRAAD